MKAESRIARGCRAGARGLALAVAAAVVAALPAPALAAGPLDPSFGTGGVSEVPLPPQATSFHGPAIFDLAPASGGGMAAALGDFAGGGFFGAARLRSDGSPDPSFGSGGLVVTRVHPRRGEAQAQGVAVQRDGRTLVVGYQDDRQKQVAPVLVRYRADGSLDGSFGDGGLVTRAPAERNGLVLHAVAVERGGRIVAVGARNERGGGRPADLVVAFRPDGRVDRGFGQDGEVAFPARRGDRLYTGLRDVVLLRGGDLLVSGYRRGQLFVARLHGDGRLDRRFGGGDGQVAIGVGDNTGCLGDCGLAAPLAVRPDGRIVVGANLARGSATLVGLRPDGRLDRRFGDRGRVRLGRRLLELKGLALQGNGRIVAAGDVYRKDAQGAPALAFRALRFLASGRLDSSFGGGAQTVHRGDASAALAALAQPNGRVVVAGGEQVDREAHLYSLLLARFLTAAG